MSFSTAVLIATVASIAGASPNPEWTNTWWTPSSAIATSTSAQSVWAPSSSSAPPAWSPSSSWAPKVNVSTSTSYTSTVYVTKPTTATTTVDCGKGTMIYGNGTAPVHKPTEIPHSWPTDLPSDWTKMIPSSVASILPPQMSGSGGIATTNCANASTTYTYTYTPSGGKPKKTSSSAPSKPTSDSHPSTPSEVPAHPDGGDDSSDSSRPSGSGFDAGSVSAGSRPDVAYVGTVLTLGAMAMAAFLL